MNNSEKNYPVRTFEDQSLRAAIFENKTKNGSFSSVRLDWTYREGNEFKNSTISLTERTLGAAGGLLEEARQFVQEKREALSQPAREEITVPVGENTQASEVLRLENQALRATVHEHQGEFGPMYSVNLERSYTQEGEQKTSAITLPEKTLLPATNLLEEATQVVRDKRHELSEAARKERSEPKQDVQLDQRKQTQSR